MRRTRLRIAGLVLLGSVLISFAESSWGMVCDASMSGMERSAMKGMAAMNAMPSGSEAGPPERGDPADTGNRADCPLAPTGNASCGVCASLPASVLPMIESLPTHVATPVATDSRAHVQNSRSIFHPPRV